jgi:hypothetical protein
MIKPYFTLNICDQTEVKVRTMLTESARDPSASMIRVRSGRRRWTCILLDMCDKLVGERVCFLYALTYSVSATMPGSSKFEI